MKSVKTLFRKSACSMLSNTIIPLGLILSCLFAASSGHADELIATQNEEEAGEQERPKIGLVLSGGGARGAAHVGVIKVLEELNVPVDYVVGTSLGAVVGALYANGRTPRELNEILDTLEWNRGFVDALDRSKLPFRRKDEEDKFQTNFELGVQGLSVTFPPGLIQGHGLYLLLQELMGGAALESDFDKFAIPYRAIATNLETTNTVVLDSGDLVKSLQASMSIPAIFAPVKIDGELLVDGGVSNNLAVDAAREMGADIILAVDISTPLSNRENLGSVPQVLGQITNLVTQRGTGEQIAKLQESDIYLRPDLTGYSSANFDAVSEISAIGEAFARENVSLLEQLSLTDSEYIKYKEQIQKTETKQLPKRIGNIVLNQNSKLSNERFMLRAELKEQSDFSTEELHRAIESIYSTDLFETIDYTLKQDTEKEDTANLVINANRRSWGTDRIQFGLVVEDDFSGENNLLLSAGYTRRQINRFGGDVRLVGRVGELPAAVIEYFQPLGIRGNYFTFVQAEHEQFSLSEFSDDTEIESFRISRSQIAGFVGWQNDKDLEFRAGISTGGGDIRQRVGIDTGSKPSSFREGIFELRFRYDTVNNKTFPTHGQKVKVVYQRGVDALNSDTDFDSLVVDALLVREFGSTRIVAGLEASDSISGTVPVQRQFSRGSILSTAGLRAQTEVGETSTRFSLLAYRPLQFSRIEALKNPLFYGAAIETGRVSQVEDTLDEDNTLISGSVFVAAETAVGPVLLGLGGKERSGLSGLLSIGLTF